MKYKFYKCSDPYIQASKERVVEIAQRAFQGIPREEVLRRFDQYEEIIVILTSDDQIVGFNFCSLHRNAKVLIVGGRLVAVDPDFKGKGYLRTASLHIFRRYYFQLLREALLGKTRQLVIFSRQCNPIAYCLLHAGQEIFPDLVNRRKPDLRAPSWASEVYGYLRHNLGLDHLDVSTGVVLNGASRAGISSGSLFVRGKRPWKTAWEDYVPKGSELITLIPVSPSFPLQFAGVLLRRMGKVIAANSLVEQLRGIAKTALVLIATLLTIMGGTASEMIRRSDVTDKIIKAWAKSCLWFYGVRVEVVGTFPDTPGMLFLARHTSLLDTFVYPAILPGRTRYIAKKELARIPLASRFFKLTGGTFIDRQSRFKSARALIRLKRSLRPTNHVFIHPEGTRTPEEKPLRPLPGYLALADTTRALVPLSAFGGERLWRAGAYFPASGAMTIKVGRPLTAHLKSSEESLDELADVYENDITWHRTHTPSSDRHTRSRPAQAALRPPR